MLQAVLLAGACTFLPLAQASAKTCDCTQHKASATGGGSCSRTEDSSKCTITFSNSSQRLAGSVKNMALRLQKEWALPFTAERAFLEMNRLPYSEIGAREFRGFFTFGLLVNTQDPKLTEIAARKLGITGSFSGSSEFNSLANQFRSRGCVEYTLNTDGYHVKYLLLHARSRADGGC